MRGVMQPLIKCNLALLTQKIALLDKLVVKYGSQEASAAFQKVCPLVGASIGQHYRHSMDHVELAALVASNPPPNNTSKLDLTPPVDMQSTPTIHYDLRVRGGTLEKDLDESRKRIVNVIDVFESMQSTSCDNLPATPVTTFFNLSGESRDEIGLPSTVGRELGFVAHHAIHHMAMVKIIALQTLHLEESELPEGFGRAPSTILFDKKQQN